MKMYLISEIYLIKFLINIVETFTCIKTSSRLVCHGLWFELSDDSSQTIGDLYWHEFSA